MTPPETAAILETSYPPRPITSAGTKFAKPSAPVPSTVTPMVELCMRPLRENR